MDALRRTVTRMERGKDAMMLSELLLRDSRADASTAKGADEVQSVHPFVVVVPMGGTSMRRIRPVSYTHLTLPTILRV